MTQTIDFSKTLYVANHENIMIEIWIYEINIYNDDGSLDFYQKITVWDKNTRKDLLVVELPAFPIFPNDIKTFDFDHALKNLEKAAIKAVKLFEVIHENHI